MKTAVIYARYSSDTQTEQSIEGQLRVCNEYAQNHDIVVLDTYIDRAMTGTNDNRPSFKKMIADSARQEWDFVLVYKLDRFSRNKYENAIHKKTLRDNGVKLLSAMENIPDTPEGTILESLLEGMNQYYSEELSQKVRRGMNESRKKGYFTGGNIPYGYRVENHRVLVDDERAKIVKYIYEQYDKGVYVKDIIRTLTDRGIYYRGKKFARNTIYNILKNEKYSGVYTLRGEKFTNIYPAIVDEELYSRVRNKTDLNKYGKRSTEVIYLLRNKVVCGYCGRPISAECGTAKNGEKVRYYKCLGRKNQSGCQKSQMKKEILEQLVLDSIVDQMNDACVIRGVVDKLMDIQEQRIRNNPELTRLIKEKRVTENAINNIMDAIEQGGQSATVMRRMRELESKLEEIERQLTIEKAKSAFRLSRNDIEKFYKHGLQKEPQLLINYFVKRIKLFDDKMVIQFNTPRQMNLDVSQGFSFCRKIVNLPVVIVEKRHYYKREFVVELCI